MVSLAAAVGCIGEIYGIGGGSILAPVVVGSGRRTAKLAPAAVASQIRVSSCGLGWLMARRPAPRGGRPPEICGPG